MKNLFSYILLILLTVSILSCKKNQTGGKSKVSGTVRHHSKIIPDAIIYIKYKSQEFPGTDVSVYDTKVTADSEGRFEINFYKGQYYLFAVGKDYGIPAPYNVIGGLGINLRTNENKELDLYVTEGD